MRLRQVFINCPFSDDYNVHFKAIVFTVIRSGCEPRCARESDDGGENRFDKIARIVADCDLGIHDISMTELDGTTGLPRFNMPLELGLFLGAKKFGGKRHSAKRLLIFDREQHRYRAFISDIAGQDVHAHADDTGAIIRAVAAWLRDTVHLPGVPGGMAIEREYRLFVSPLPAICAARGLDPSEITFRDFTHMTAEWIASDE